MHVVCFKAPVGPTILKNTQLLLKQPSTLNVTVPTNVGTKYTPVIKEDTKNG